jgi:haloalkane dehalogenase
MPADRDWRPLFPFRPHFLELDGVCAHYVDEGAGEVLLMVHGNPTWSFVWRQCIAHWNARYRTIAPDHVGCGLSDKPAKYPYSLAQHTANLVRLIDTLQLDNITLFGHDWGGAIGLNAATQRPDRFRRFVLFNTAAFPPPRVPLRLLLCKAPLFGRLAVQGFNAFSAAALRMATAKPWDLAPAVRAGLTAPYDSWDHRVGIHGFLRDIPLSPDHPTWRELCELQSRLDQFRQYPVQLVWGMRDWCFTEECLVELTRLFPQAEVHRIDAAGHWVMEDAADELLEVVDRFLATSRATPPCGMSWGG